MNILVAVEELRVGGAQTFALRLAQALHEAGHRVCLYSMYWQLTEHDLVKRLAPDVELFQYQPAIPAADNLLMRAEGWLQRRRQRVMLRAGRLRRHLYELIKTREIQVVHSHTFKCDHLLAQVLRRLPAVPLVVTMHGDYEQFLAFYRSGNEYVIPGYRQQLTETLARINGIAYLSEQNLEVLEADVAGTTTQHIQVRRIYNGLAAHFSAELSRFSRPALGIPPEALVFGMVARGVPEKGWEPLIAAYQQLKARISRPVHLLLVGGGPFLELLREKHRDDADLHFLGFANNPVDSVQAIDVGVLASSLKESLPNSIAEYLFCEKPVISTDIGEIRRMLLTDDGQAAGLLIDFPAQGLTDAQQLYQAMYRYATDEQLFEQHRKAAGPAFRKFDMARCVQAYTELYQLCRASVSQTV